MNDAMNGGEPLIPRPLRILFDAVCEGSPTVEQVAELEAILRRDEHARHLYREYCRLHVELHFAIRGRRAMSAVSNAIRKDSIQQPKQSPILGWLGDAVPQGWGFVSNHSLWFSLLAVVIILGAATLNRLPRLVQTSPRQARDEPPLVGSASHGKVPGEVRPSTVTSVAQLMRASDCRWNQARFTAGAALAAGQQLNLAAGEAEIVFQCGAVVVVRGPTILEIESGKVARLVVGRISARADTTESHGFTLRTQGTSVVDLGTEFHVQTASDGHSEVYVSAGAVEIRTAKNDIEHRLTAGQTAQIEPGNAGIFAVIESGDDTSAFKFPSIEPPSHADFADISQHHATIRVAEGKLATDSGPAEVLLDGKGQSDRDSPAESAFFANNEKGKFLLDLGATVGVQTINSYSWHAYAKVPAEHDRYDVRATQRYNLYGYAGEHPPATHGELVANGWTLISRVNTDAFFSVPPVKNRPKQQGVSIRAAKGDIGRYRYLLWDVKGTHVEQFSGHEPEDENTFFGEFDVYAK